jgi:glyoxylase-like metal-dependent hydrolase (beta-lactamase superfamily II)
MKYLAAALLALAPATALAQSDPVAAYLQSPYRVAPGVTVLRQNEPVFAGVNGNVTVIEQSDGLVLVDTGHSHGAGKHVVELVRKISPKPVKAVVISHWHNDHPLGLSAILEAWPNADVIAHEETIKDIKDGRMVGIPDAPSKEWEAQRAAGLTKAYEDLKAELAKATTDAERTGWARTFATRDLRIAQSVGTHRVIPRRGFTGTLSLPDSVAPVELMFLGRANTSGDISAWLPNQRVLVAGDAVVEPVPYMFNVYPSDMLTVFDKMRALNYRVLVPGHGVPQHDTAYLHRVAGLVREVQRQVAPLARRKVPADRVAARTNFKAQRDAFSGGDAWLAYWFDRYTLAPLIDSVYREAQGKVGPPPVAR